MAHMFCLKFTVSDKEDVQSSVSRISFKEHKSVSHNKAVKKKKNTWGKFLATVSLQALLEMISKAPSFRRFCLSATFYETLSCLFLVY